MSGSKKTSRYCAVKGCHTKHGYKWVYGSKVYSRFCAAHTCGAKEPFVDVFCANPKEPEDRYCGGHSTMACYARGCGTLVNNPRDVPRPWFCVRHACNVPTCYKPKDLPHPYCRPHMMQLPPSPRGGIIAGVAATPGPRPMPRCRVPDCREPQTKNSAWCTDHTCDVPRCHNETFDDDEHRCIEHMPCPERGCDGYCEMNRAGDGVKNFCRRHMYCERSGCDNDRDDDGRFCKYHTCRIADCDRGSDREANRQFCSRHTCGVSTCTQVVADADNPHSRICQDHKCAEAACLDRGAAVGGCCPRHKCARTECYARRVDTYCHEHECATGGCHAAAAVPGGHCLESPLAGSSPSVGGSAHGCIKPGCRSRRANDPDAPRLCREHLKDALRAKERAHVEAELKKQRLAEEEERKDREREEKLFRAYKEQERMRLAEELERERAREERERAREERDRRDRERAREAHEEQIREEAREEMREQIRREQLREEQRREDLRREEQRRRDWARDEWRANANRWRGGR